MQRAALVWMLGFLALTAQAKILDCSKHTPIGELCRIEPREVRPTQFAVGRREVDKKRSKLAKHARKDKDALKEFLKRNPAPMVRGPKARLYYLDHHHLALAADEEGIDQIFGEIREDWSHLSKEDFWKAMLQANWVYLFDQSGMGPRDPSELPKSIEDLEDDIYRSLAGEVKEQGGFVKVDQFFVEFQWANFFRTRIPCVVVATDFDSAVATAMKLARSKAAKQLPGYIP